MKAYKLTMKFIVVSIFYLASNNFYVAQEMVEPETKKEIITLNYNIRTKASSVFVSNLTSYVKQNGGYLVYLNRGQVQFRVPKQVGRKNIDQKLSSIAGVQIFRASRQNNDVSIRLVDLKSKLKASEQNLAKLRELSSSAGLDDLLDLETAMNRSLQKVDNLKGEISYLETSSSLFIVSIQINSTRISSDPNKVPIPWIRNLGLQGLTGGMR